MRRKNPNNLRIKNGKKAHADNKTHTNTQTHSQLKGRSIYTNLYRFLARNQYEQKPRKTQ